MELGLEPRSDSKCVSRSVMSDSLWPHGLYITSQASHPWDSPGKDTGVACHFLLQGIFQVQGSTQVSYILWDSLPSEPKDHAFLIYHIMAMTTHSPNQLSIPFHSQIRWREAGIPLEPRLLSTLLLAPAVKSFVSIRENNPPLMLWTAIGISLIPKLYFPRLLILSVGKPGNSHVYSPTKVLILNEI